MERVLEAQQLEVIRSLDACTLSNAIETLNVRLRNEGFADSSIRSMFPELPAMLGYAATARVRCSGPPPAGHTYYDRTDWWHHLLSVPAPRVVIIQDVDVRPGLGAFVGEVHSAILAALGCVGLVTNGAVRDLEAVERAGFPLFASHVAVSHAYAHLIDFGGPVTVGGLEVRPRDLIFGDRHGILAIPLEIAADLAAVARQMSCVEKKVVDFCRSPEFSVPELSKLVKDLG